MDSFALICFGIGILILSIAGVVLGVHDSKILEMKRREEIATLKTLSNSLNSVSDSLSRIAFVIERGA